VAALFLASLSWAYLGIAFVLWIFVFGDDSSTFGFIAAAGAVPVALLLSAAYSWYTKKHAVTHRFLGTILVMSTAAEVFFLWCITA